MTLIENIIGTKNAPTVLLFGGNPVRRLQVLKLVSTLGDVSILGALSEEEGIALLKETCKINLVLIGGAYTREQRKRIKNFLQDHDNTIRVTEPGFEYQYSNENIKNDIAKKLGLTKMITEQI